VYQNGNTKHLSTSVLQAITLGEPRSALEELTRREYALLVLAVSGLTLALLPVLLHLLGTRWQPGPAIQGGSGHLPGRSPSSSASKTRPHQPALPR